MTKKPLEHPFPLVKRLGYLDALRGFAALYVVVYHVSLIPNPALDVPGWLKAFVSFGSSGVVLFFVISGFSMCLTWGRHVKTGMPLRSFYISRLFRIAPLFYLWLILSLVRDLVFKGEAGLHSANEIAANAFFLFNFYEPFQLGIVWASWTIGAEMVFYFVFPAIATYVGASLLKSITLLLSSICAIMVAKAIFGGGMASPLLHAMLSGVGFLNLLPAFLFGIVTFYFHELLESKALIKLRRPIGYLLTLSAIGGIALIIVERSEAHYWYYATSACYSSLLLAFSSFGRNPLINLWSLSLGKGSYSLYLNHPSLVYVLAPLYMIIYRMGYGKCTSFMACVTLTLVILVPLSYLTFRFVEKPFMHLGKRFLVFSSPKLLKTTCPQDSI